MSSVSSVPGSPSSPLAAYRGRHSASVGRACVCACTPARVLTRSFKGAFDGLALSRLARDDSDDDDS